jgi:hypothetical protein
MIVRSLFVTRPWITAHERARDPYRQKRSGRPLIRSLLVATRLQLLISIATAAIKPGSKGFAAHGKKKRNDLKGQPRADRGTLDIELNGPAPNAMTYCQ